MAREYRWDLFPILADALEDAGCDDEDMLNTLRTCITERCFVVLGKVLGRENPS